MKKNIEDLDHVTKFTLIYLGLFRKTLAKGKDPIIRFALAEMGKCLDILKDDENPIIRNNAIRKLERMKKR